MQGVAAPPLAIDLATQLREQRRRGQIDQARAVLALQLAHASGAPQAPQALQARLAHLAWQHEPFWWQPLAGRSTRLRRRGPDDVALLRRAWLDADFMRRFNRMAGELPEQDDALRSLLTREHWALPEESRALHWTIEAAGQACGLVSVVDISLQHRRGEFLIGVLPDLAPGASPWLALEAAHLVFEFLSSQVKLERLTAYFYPDNLAALQMAQKLGFEREGVLKGYLRLPQTGQRADLIVAGLLIDEAFFERHERLRQRLLARA